MITRSIKVLLLTFIGILFSISIALSHAPLCSCYDNKDDTILCDGGFSDGASASGTPIKILSLDGRILIDGRMNKASEFTFKKPDVPFKIIFEGGAGHNIEINQSDIH